MNGAKRIGVFYSRGPHFERVVRTLREQYPDAHITAIVPPVYRVSVPEEDVAAVMETESPHYGPGNVRAGYRLVRRLRGERFDVFAVMFASSALGVLAASSGAPVCLHGTMDGRLVPLSASLPVVLWQILRRVATGRTVYAAAWLAVRCLPVREKGQD